LLWNELKIFDKNSLCNELKIQKRELYVKKKKSEEKIAKNHKI